MPRADSEFAVRTKGLGKLNRDLGRIDKDLRRESVRHLRETARDVRDDARPTIDIRTGQMARSLRFQASNRGASVSSNHPGAGVQEYGGTISPRGVPITIQPKRFLGRAVQRNTPRIEEAIADLLDVVARRNGFH